MLTDEERLEKCRIYAKKRYKKLKDAGLCVKCGDCKAIEGKTRCPICEKWDTVKRKLRRSEMTKEERRKEYIKQKERLQERMKDPVFCQEFKEKKRKYKREYKNKYKNCDKDGNYEN